MNVEKNNVHVVFFDVRAKSIDKEGKCEYTVMRIKALNKRKIMKKKGSLS